MMLPKPRFFLALALALASAAPALAAGRNGIESLLRPSQPTQQDALWVSARVERLNVPAHKITISHQAIARAGMPSMAMTFQVADNAQLALLQQGDPVDIQVANRNGGVEVVNFRTPH
jgi:Cu/Ag efflux protein CusF